jgi:hypothetical protein
MREPHEIVSSEVLCCATKLIATLASGHTFALAEQARSLFGSGERDEQEVLSHWFVSYWLAEKLEKAGETVDRNFAGLAVWGRKTTGQRIECDDVIREICEGARA